MQKDTSQFYIYGRHPVVEMLTEKPESIKKIFFKESIEKDMRKSLESLAQKNQISVGFVDDNQLRKFVGEVNHQGVIALVGEVLYTEFDTWLESLNLEENPACVVLDELTDPHNVGAIIRSATAFGVSGIIFGKHNQSPINGTVLKTSAGTALRIPLIRVSNINAALDALKKKGFWVAGLAMDGKTQLNKQDMHMPLAFIVGSEGSGIRQKTLERADFVIRIPMEAGVESLNASVSTALVLYEWKRAKFE